MKQNYDMVRLFRFILLLAIILLTACTPYNSSEANKKLLLGKWHLVNLRYTHPDSSKLNILRDTAAYLTFRGDSLEERVNGNLIKTYSFNVKQYMLYWSADSSVIAKTSIVSISEDTFKMKNPIYEGIYTRKKE